MKQVRDIHLSSRMAALPFARLETTSQIKFVFMMLWAFFVLLSPGLTPRLWAQCTTAELQECRSDCGPIQDVGKQAFGVCVARCTAKCGKLPPKNTCKNGSGSLFPKYYILGLVYAPPGCGSATQKCSTQSVVDYQASSAMGTKVSTDTSFAQNVNVSVDASFGVPGIGKLDLGASGGYGNTSTDTKSQTITKGQSLDIKTNGNGDGVDHNQDAFILLLNPAVAVRETQSSAANGQCGPTAVNWYMGLSGASGTQQRYTVYVQWLKNPSTMPPNVAQQLQALGFTNDDYQTILAQDPFANGAPTPDLSRFAPMTYSFPYEPPLQQPNCNNGVCSCLSMSGTIKNQLQTDSESKVQKQYNVGFSEKLSGIDIGIFSIGAGSDQKFTWTSSSTDADTTDSSQSATATVACPTPGYLGPTIVSTYWDKLFGSILFVPTVIGSSQTSVIHQGTAIGVTGQPVTHEAVTLLVAGKTYHTWTNNHGDYVFFRPAGLQHVSPATTGQLSIRGISQTVTLGLGQKLQTRIP